MVWLCHRNIDYKRLQVSGSTVVCSSGCTPSLLCQQCLHICSSDVCMSCFHHSCGHRSAYGFQGQMSGDDLSAAYASGDVFMMPSESETLGFVALEAMASGLPVVAVAAGGLTDILTNPGVTGLHITCCLAFLCFCPSMMKFRYACRALWLTAQVLSLNHVCSIASCMFEPIVHCARRHQMHVAMQQCPLRCCSRRASARRFSVSTW